MTTSASPTASSRSSSNGASGSSLPRFRSFLQMLNWRRDPVVEMQIELSEQRTKQLEKEIEQLKNGRVQIENEIEQLKKDNALLDWMLSEIDLIEADLPSSSTPRQAGLIQSVSHSPWPGLSASVEVGGTATLLCPKPFLPQPIST